MLCYSRFFSSLWQHNNLSTTTRCTCNTYSTRFKWNEENVWIKSRNSSTRTHTVVGQTPNDKQQQPFAVKQSQNETHSMHLHGCAPSQYHRRIIITIDQKKNHYQPHIKRCPYCQFHSKCIQFCVLHLKCLDWQHTLTHSCRRRSLNANQFCLKTNYNEFVRGK